MNKQNSTIFGIDLGTTYSCIAYVDEYGKAVVVPNSEGDRTTPSVVQFDGSNRIVGKEAKRNAVMSSDTVVSMVKRHMGEADWRFEYNGIEYTAEEISSYILRKLADDTEQYLGFPVTDVVITCPAYFGIAEREATARAGQVAGFNVREIINEPTAAAIMYGLQNEQDQVVLVYDLGGGTFDITAIEIKSGAITVVATGGDHRLGGRDWDQAIVMYLAEQWKAETGSLDEPTDDSETLQDLWTKAEDAKKALTTRNETKVSFVHAGQRVSVSLSREKFNELTDDLLRRTIAFTKGTMEDAEARGVQHFDQILLVGGSTRMPQVAEQLQLAFNIPHKIFDPDEAVAKGAAIYGQKLLLDEKIQIKVAERMGTNVDDVVLTDAPTVVVERAKADVARDLGLKVGAVKRLAETAITNVSSHSFGIVATADHGTVRQREVIANLVVVNDPLPVTQMQQFFTLARQDTVELRIMETLERTKQVEPDKFDTEAEIGNVVLKLPTIFPPNTRIEVIFELDRQGRLHVVSREPTSGAEIEATIETNHGMSEEELQEAMERATKIGIS